VAEIPCTFQFGAISKHSWKVPTVSRQINFGGGAKIAGASRSQIAIRSMTSDHFNATSCAVIKTRRAGRNPNRGFAGWLRGEKRVHFGPESTGGGSKPLSTAPKSCALTTSYQTAACGHPLIVKSHPDLEEGSTNEQGLTFAATCLFNAQSMSGTWSPPIRQVASPIPRWIQLMEKDW
jgi:hypothetical protein